MADIERNPNELVAQDPVLKKKHLIILLNEKANQLKQLDVRLEHIQTVEVKQLEFKQATLHKEIAYLKHQIGQIRAN
jgi:hypothetical protein